MSFTYHRLFLFLIGHYALLVTASMSLTVINPSHQQRLIVVATLLLNLAFAIVNRGDHRCGNSWHAFKHTPFIMWGTPHLQYLAASGALIIPLAIILKKCLEHLKTNIK